jgi:hypothetical protein
MSLSTKYTEGRGEVVRKLAFSVAGKQSSLILLPLLHDKRNFGGSAASGTQAAIIPPGSAFLGYLDSTVRGREQ